MDSQGSRSMCRTHLTVVPSKAKEAGVFIQKPPLLIRWWLLLGTLAPWHFQPGLCTGSVHSWGHKKMVLPQRDPDVRAGESLAYKGIVVVVQLRLTLRWAEGLWVEYRPHLLELLVFPMTCAWFHTVQFAPETVTVIVIALLYHHFRSVHLWPELLLA